MHEKPPAEIVFESSKQFAIYVKWRNNRLASRILQDRAVRVEIVRQHMLSSDDDLPETIVIQHSRHNGDLGVSKPKTLYTIAERKDAAAAELG